MRLIRLVHALRKSLQLTLMVLMLCAVVSPVFSQNITLKTPLVERGNAELTTIMFRSNDLVQIRWEEPLAGLKLKIGDVPGIYGLYSVQMRGDTSSSFRPSVVGIPVGVYYGVLTSSDADTFTEIQLEASSNPATRYSKDFMFIVESEESPTILAPTGTIEERVPTFEWESIPGVVSYAVVVSSTPFSISPESGGNLTIDGLNPVWMHLTTQTSALYGERFESDPLIQFDPLPLVLGSTYYYTVLNSYSKTDLGFLSSVTSSIASFTLGDAATLASADLSYPVGNERITERPDIEFEWENVENALSYDLSIFERISDSGRVSDVMVYSSNTPNEFLTVPASEVFRSGDYRWFVIANDREGAGSTSVFGEFSYVTDMGEFTFKTMSANDGSDIIGVTVRARSTDGGYNPPANWINPDGATYTDSLTVGNYEFKASKSGFAEITIPVVIQAGSAAQVELNLVPLPSRINGQVIDGDGVPVNDATVNFVDVVTGQEYEARTNFQGIFSIDLTMGTFRIGASKAGFRSSSTITLSVAEQQILSIPTPFVILNDNVVISGRITNQDGISVSQAEIKATKGDESISTVTDGEGLWSLALSEGIWSLSISKEGFLAPMPRELALFAGDDISDVDFVLIQQASRIEGLIQGVRTLPDGRIERVPIADAEIIAYPLSGSGISVRSDDQGRYIMDLGTGFYSVFAQAEGFSTSAKIDLFIQPNEVFRDIRFSLEEFDAEVFGRVVDSNGNGIEGAVVISSEGAETISETGGSYRLPVQSIPQWIRATSSGYVSSSRVRIAPGVRSQISGVDLPMMQNAGLLSGAVRTVSGVLPGVVVTASSGIDVYQTMTDAHGRYELNLPGGLWNLNVSSPRYRLPIAVNQAIRPGQRTESYDFWMEEDYVRYYGYVTDGQQGLSRVQLRAERQDQFGETDGVLITVSGDDGRYAALYSASTRFELMAAETGFKAFLHSFTTDNPGAETGFDIQLIPSESVITGRVVDENGSNIPHVQVSATIGGFPRVQTTSSSEGDFVLNLEGGTYVLKAEAPGFDDAQIDLTINAGQQVNNVVLTLTSSRSTLITSVIDPRDGTPVSGASVFAEGSGIRSGLTNDDGIVTLSGIPSGSFELMITARGFASVIRTVFLEPNTTSRQTFVMVPASGSISGRVLSSSTQNLSDATVRLRGSDLDRSTQTNLNGEYAFTDLPFGSFSLSAQKEGYSLAPGEAATISFVNMDAVVPSILLKSARGSIQGIVQESVTGTPLVGVVVEASGSQGTVSTRTDAEGKYELRGLEGGTWNLDAVLSGYRFDPLSRQVSSGQTTTVPLTLTQNTAALTGRVRHQTGAVLPFDVSVEIRTSRDQKQVISAADGRFSFDSLPHEEEFELRTRIQREGYVDVERSVFIPEGTTQFDTGDILVPHLSASITGTTGVGNASVRISSSGETIAITKSADSGNFSVPFLAPGNYLIEPTKLGYTFSPASQLITVSDGQTQEVSFSTTSNIGLVQIRLVTRQGATIPNIPVRITSLDRSLDITLHTDQNGLVLPQELPLGQKYRVEPISGDYLFDPVFQELDLTAQSEITLDFTVVRINSFISGTTQDESGEALNGVSVTANAGPGTQFDVVSAGGMYSLGPVPPGTYTITGRKSGFIPATFQVMAGENSQITTANLVLQRQSVLVRGHIFRAGDPVSDIQVSLSGPVDLIAETDETGIYEFPNVPVSENGLTAVEIAVLRDGRLPIVRLINLSALDIGQVVQLEDIHLASGQVVINLDDGASPLSGIGIIVQGGGGVEYRGATDATGMYATPAELGEGTFVVDVIDTNRLVPVSSVRTFTLISDDDTASLRLALPFYHVPKDVIRSDERVQILVESNDTSASANRIGRVTYRLPGAAESTVNMSFQDGVFVASLPAPGEGVLRYSIQILNDLGSVEFASSQIERETVVAGQLQELRIAPDLGGRLLRVGEEYELVVSIRDGLGLDLTFDILNQGTTTWTALSSQLDVTDSSSASQIKARVVPKAAGTHQFQIRITFQQQVLVVPVQFDASETEVTDLLLTPPAIRMSNNGKSMRIVVTGKNESGEDVLLGNSVSWTAVPEQAVVVDQNGQLKTIDRQFIGPVSIYASEADGGRTDSTHISIYADLTGAEPRTLTDFAGLEIFLPATAIPFPAEFSLSYPRTPTPKRFDSGVNGGSGLTAGERTYRFTLKSDRGLLGDSLAAPATLTLPQDASLRLFDGDKAVGFFEEALLAWRALPSVSSDIDVNTSVANQIGEYTVVSQNKPLGIPYFELLPSPFSPEIAPLQMAYFLETNAPPAQVSIHVLNMRGELVRTILDGDMQWAGQYGGRNGFHQIEWDGLTEDGKKARNGRYIIRIEAKDQTGTTSRNVPVVLIK